MKTKPTAAPGSPATSEQGYVRSFRHWRSKKLIVCTDYGLKAFPIGKGRKKKK